MKSLTNRLIDQLNMRIHYTTLCSFSDFTFTFYCQIEYPRFPYRLSIPSLSFQIHISAINPSLYPQSMLVPRLLLTCDPSCLTCSNLSTSCDSCYSGMYLDSTLRICLYCNTECATCATDPYSCLSCFNSYYLDTTSTPNTCLLCSLPCKTCTGTTTCTSCYNGYFADSSFTCQSCDTGCLSCTDSLSTTCTACFPGYYLLAGQCYICDNTCETCSDGTSCDSCFDNYVLSSNSCNTCPANCASCPTLSTDCSSCLSGFYLNSSKTCSLCNAACITCTSSGKSNC